MDEDFQLRIRSDEKFQNIRKRTHTIEIPNISQYTSNYKVQVPKSYDGLEVNNCEKYLTPEHYYLAAISGCFSTTFSVIASNSDLNYNDLEIQTRSFIKSVSTGKIIDKVTQKIILKIPPSISKEKAKKVLKATEKACPIANSIKTKIENKYSIIIESTK